jgi:hypothetical protein
LPTITTLALSAGTGGAYSSTGGTYSGSSQMIYQSVGNSSAAIATIETSGTEL